jgi:hypothetical protein
VEETMKQNFFYDPDFDFEIDKPILFHGGCLGCTQQENNHIKFCIGCCYFKPDWSLPNLNNKPPTEMELIKEKMLEIENERIKWKKP